MCKVQTVLFGYFGGGNSSNFAKPGTVCTRVVNWPYYSGKSGHSYFGSGSLEDDGANCKTKELLQMLIMGVFEATDAV
jgi:hypothetical protein